jgi:hypothetical protein
MNKERFSQIVDEVYQKYTTKYMGHEDIPSKDLFLFEIKKNKEFSERWGLKIEERDLTMREQEMLGHNYGHLTWEEQANFHFEPTKLITMTYNSEKIEIYE